MTLQIKILFFLKVGYFPMAYVVEESEEDALAGQLNNASL